MKTSRRCQRGRVARALASAVREGHPLYVAEPLESRTLLAVLPVGGEIHVNTTTERWQFRPAVAMRGDGAFTVVWESLGSYDIFGQRYGAAGEPLGREFRVNTTTAGEQAYPAIAMSQAGDSVVTWQDRGGREGWRVYAQRFDSGGEPIGEELRVSTSAFPVQGMPAVAMDDDGDFVVAWIIRHQDGSEYGVYAQRYAASGQRLGGEFRVNVTTGGTQWYPDVAMDADGEFVVTWQHLTGWLDESEADGVYARRYAANGQPRGSEFRVTSAQFSSDYGNSTPPAVAASSDGDFVIAWPSYGKTRAGWDVYARRYNEAGEQLGGEFRVNTSVADHHQAPDVASTADGAFIVAWESHQHGEWYDWYGLGVLRADLRSRWRTAGDRLPRGQRAWIRRVDRNGAWRRGLRRRLDRHRIVRLHQRKRRGLRAAVSAVVQPCVGRRHSLERPQWRRGAGS